MATVTHIMSDETGQQIATSNAAMATALDALVNAQAPTKTSDLENDSGYQTSAQVAQAISEAVAGIQKMTKQVVDALPATGEDNVMYLVPDDKGKANKDMYLYIGGEFVLIGNTEVDLAGYALTSSLSAVATSGSYDDLTGKPSIPSLTGYATETYVDDAIDDALGVIANGRF